MKSSSEDQKSLRKAQQDVTKLTKDRTSQEKDHHARDAELENAKKKEEVRMLGLTE